MNNDELLITKLIEETCKEEVESTFKDAIVSDLSLYFEKRVNQVEYHSLKKYVEQQQLNAFSILFNESTRCYRVSIGSIQMDFPSNWSVFSSLQSIEFTYVKKEDDEDFLCDIFTEIDMHCESFMLVNDSGDFNLITFDQVNNKKHYEWMLGYFDKKKSTKKAA